MQIINNLSKHILLGNYLKKTFDTPLMARIAITTMLRCFQEIKDMGKEILQKLLSKQIPGTYYCFVLPAWSSLTYRFL